MNLADTPDTPTSIEDFSQIEGMISKMKTSAKNAIADLEKAIAEKNVELAKCGRVCHEEASAKIVEFLKQERDKHRKTVFHSFEIASLLNTFADTPTVETHADQKMKIKWVNPRIGFNPLRYTEPIELFMALGLTDELIETFAADAATSYGCVKRGANAKELHNRAKGLATELLALDDQKNTITSRLQSLLAAPKEQPTEEPRTQVVRDGFVILTPDPTEPKITITQE